MSRINT